MAEPGAGETGADQIGADQIGAGKAGAASGLMSTYRAPRVSFVRGEGSWLYDADGRSYLDFLCGIAVTSLGHAHPGVADALGAQARRLLHVSNLFGNEFNEEVAGVIDTLVGDGVPAGGKVFFANSGAEANECALKLARRASGPGRYVVVSALGSFHGRTLATLAATGQPAKHAPFAPLPSGFIHVAYGDAAALEPLLARDDVAAALLEPLLGESGVVEPPDGYLAHVRRLCDTHGVLLALDEIQTGLGRTGRWFAFQREGIVPDMVTIAKSLGNGMPVGACWAAAEVADAFSPGDHGSTFGGQPLALSAARATLAALRALDAPNAALGAGLRLEAAFGALDGVASVRGKGLLRGIVLEDGIDAAAVAAAALDAGLIVNNPVPGVLRVAPPLNVSAAEIDEAAAILAGVLQHARKDHSVARSGVS